MPKDREPWFAARESGASFYPVTWQGYAVLIAYIILLSASAIAIAKSWALFIGLAVGLSVLLMIIVSAKSSEF